MKGIIVVPIGSIDEDVLQCITEGLRKVFRCRVGLGGGMPVPKDSYNAKRGQYLSTEVLGKIRAMKLEGYDLMLGVTDVDLYAPRLNFVFGETDVFAGIAVISLARLGEEFYGHRTDRDLLLMRAVKEAIHEIGHTNGLDHCNDPLCIMFFSNSLSDTDRKGPGFCGVCREKLGI
jgi:archaemetzincin